MAADMNSEASEDLIEIKADSMPAAARSPWPFSLGLLAILVVAIGVAFHADVWRTVQIWYIYPAYSHGFLILPISLWLIWEKRAELRAMTPVAEPRALPLAILPALMWLVGYFSTTTEIRQFAIVAFIEVALLAILGWRIYWAILFPALFLFFLIPTGEYLIPPLQRMTADFTDAGLNMFGVVHYREGTAFELINGRYEIAEACAGLRFLTATFTLGTLFCYLTYRRWWKVAAFLVACVVLPIVANGLRVLATVMVANYTNNQVAAGVDHIVYGWGFAVAIMLALLYLGSLFRDPIPEAEPTAKPTQKIRANRGISIAAAAALAVAIGLGPVIAARASQSISPPNLAALSGSLVARGWTVLPLSGSWQPTFTAPAAEFKGSLQTSDMAGAPVDLVVDDFVNAARDGSLIAMKNRLWDAETWTETSAWNMNVMVGSRPAILSEHVISSSLGERLVWDCYWIGGRITTSPAMVKWLQLRGIFGARDEAAVIVLSTPIDGTTAEARKKLMKVLAVAGDPILQHLDSTTSRE